MSTGDYKVHWKRRIRKPVVKISYVRIRAWIAATSSFINGLEPVRHNLKSLLPRAIREGRANNLVVLCVYKLRRIYTHGFSMSTNSDALVTTISGKTVWKSSMQLVRKEESPSSDIAPVDSLFLPYIVKTPFTAFNHRWDSTDTGSQI